jgi:Co/Zn/Cd efflux system component
MLTMHIVLAEQPADSTAIVRRVKETLRSEFEITHSTIEMEVGDCADA